MPEPTSTPQTTSQRRPETPLASRTTIVIEARGRDTIVTLETDTGDRTLPPMLHQIRETRANLLGQVLCYQARELLDLTEDQLRARLLQQIHHQT